MFHEPAVIGTCEREQDRTQSFSHISQNIKCHFYYDSQSQKFESNISELQVSWEKKSNMPALLITADPATMSST